MGLSQSPHLNRSFPLLPIWLGGTTFAGYNHVDLKPALALDDLDAYGLRRANVACDEVRLPQSSPEDITTATQSLLAAQFQATSRPMMSAPSSKR